ncbi:MAG: hypothetical protein AB7S77_18730 [Desulfatirhabdiaceae bacterium]
MTEATDPLNDMDEIDDDWTERILCPDESCTGTIGPNGQCRVCGRHAEGFVGSDMIATESEPGLSHPEKTDEITNSGDQNESGDAWAERQVCRDESCIGTIGPDGRCRICGLSASDDH